MDNHHKLSSDLQLYISQKTELCLKNLLSKTISKVQGCASVSWILLEPELGSRSFSPGGSLAGEHGCQTQRGPLAAYRFWHMRKTPLSTWACSSPAPSQSHPGSSGPRLWRERPVKSTTEINQNVQMFSLFLLQKSELDKLNHTLNILNLFLQLDLKLRGTEGKNSDA